MRAPELSVLAFWAVSQIRPNSAANTICSTSGALTASVTSSWSPGASLDVGGDHGWSPSPSSLVCVSVVRSASPRDSCNDVTRMLVQRELAWCSASSWKVLAGCGDSGSASASRC
jgi:hypothetical protein